MKIVDTKYDAQFYGEALVDLMHTIERELLMEDDKHVYVLIQSYPFGDIYYVVNSKSCFGDTTDMPEPLEMYHELSETKESKYNQIFVELDKELYEKVKETMDQVDDTKYCGGIRYGAQFNNKGLNTYLEGVTYLSKEDKYIYLQVYQNMEGITYSVTDTSIFLRMELGPMYAAYYGKKPEVPYLIETNDLEALGEYNYLKDDFIDLKGRLDKKIEDMKKNSD